ncbi:MAG: D-alanyl-lipoteichoic acid biosynthesis protein DltD, partial [Peptostreptococcaceae bacterium]
MKKFICIISPLIIGVITFIGINKFLNNEIENLLENKNLKSVAISYGDIYKDKGVVLNEYFSNDNSIIIQGSSELSSDVEQLPTRFFPVEDFKYNIVTNGRAYVQNLQHASILGSNYSDMSNIKLALVVSLQWFENGNGISDESFESTFSPVQFYRYLSNE